MKTALMMQEWWCQQSCLFLFRVLMETDPEEHRLNYERYRTLVMIDYSGGQSISCLLPLSMDHNDVNKQKPGNQLSKKLETGFMGTLCQLGLKRFYVQGSHKYINWKKNSTYISTIWAWLLTIEQ